MDVSTSVISQDTTVLHLKMRSFLLQCNFCVIQ